MQKIRYKFSIVALLVFALIVPLTGVFAMNPNAVYVWSSSVEVSADVQVDLNLTSTSAVLMDQRSGNILYEHNMHEQLRPASVTKVMTLLLIFEALESGTISLDDQVGCSEKARSMGGSQIWLDETETLSVHEMIKAIAVVSANDASVAMAEFIAGSEEAFVEKMNARARELRYE